MRRSNGGARRATRRCAARPSRRRSPISARRSRWRTRRARRRGRAARRSERATDAVAGRLRQRALCGARAWRAGNDRSVRQSPRVGGRRQGCARTTGGRLRSVGRQLRARRVAIDAGARGGLPQRRRGEARFAGGRRRPSHRRDRHAGSPASIAKRGIIWNARSPCSNPAATTIWPFASDMDPGVAQCSTSRSRCGRSATSNARFPSSTTLQARIASLTHVGTHAHAEKCTRPCSN